MSVYYYSNVSIEISSRHFTLGRCIIHKKIASVGAKAIYHMAKWAMKLLLL